MNSNTSIINFIIPIDKANTYTSSVVSNINNNLDQDRLRHSRLLAYSRQLQEEENDDDEYCTLVNIYREHKRHLEQDKKARTQLDIQALDNDLYEPVHDNFLHNSTSPRSSRSSSDVDMGRFLSSSNGINPCNGTVIDGI
ncbi:2501_t:CDS:1 [Cetraspora pellucida]|uniref:2501_t:CDS:1 n=1 Tax=Cetraspora pellucida TaxID=1433469 RepID=A0A9N9F6P8_9GLOM|nr:2501_t:CDS:1 [Cetraspora pellucida]